ncbi:phytoene desaturase family protein [Amycolatopsis methanolica]|uniref:Phytoene dehydrogenase n=1 Tax=Amycolatopsis methanolica 239 TaxID=1068978 RepID=A0A076MRX4_AMYME|nr:phytoene desaturase family protein [Amycolatopsis methanolica]AIJ23419.1 phytoene dehydrogenase [Amycolatopsis methanolica 239]
MRTVTGPADRIVVVGAGLSGLAAALHLAGRGRQVTVVERAPVPGGRAGRLDLDGYRVDTGPTVLTMPDLVDETLAAVGDSLANRLDLVPVTPAYRARFADGSSLDVHSDPEAMTEAVRAFAGPSEADGYRRLRQWLTRLYRTEFDRFIGANFDSPLALVTPHLARLVAMGAFGPLDRKIGRFLRDERLRRVFSFQSLYAGQSPQHALAVYAVIAYMDTVAGVFFPRGGMRALPDALAAAAADAGVEFRYGAEVTALRRSGSRVTAVETTGGSLPADAVVLTTELPTAYELLGRTPRRPVPLRPAPSAVVVHVGTRQRCDTAHHTILFGAAWRRTFHELIHEGRLMSDPSLLVTRPTATDPALAPDGRDLLYVLAPAPNLRRGPVDWDRVGDAYADEVLGHVAERLLPGLGDGIEARHVVTPADWARQGMLAGTPFALAHTVAQTGPFRPRNLVRGAGNVVLAGGSTAPGVGVPTALVSGRLAADRITGARVTRPLVAAR